MNKVESFLYRNSHPEVTMDDYFIATKVEFADVAEDSTVEEIEKMWMEFADRGLEYHKSPISDSEYMIDRKTGDIYRKSNHWGDRISTCQWTLKRGNVRLTTCYTVAKANIADFEAIITPDYLMRLYVRHITSFEQ